MKIYFFYLLNDRILETDYLNNYNFKEAHLKPYRTVLNVGPHRNFNI